MNTTRNGVLIIKNGVIRTGNMCGNITGNGMTKTTKGRVTGYGEDFDYRCDPAYCRSGYYQ